MKYELKFTKEAASDGLFEIKSDRIRSIYTYKNNQLILILVIFLKKTQKTPKKYIMTALKRLKEYKDE